jgi:hypothetical protein
MRRAGAQHGRATDDARGIIGPILLGERRCVAAGEDPDRHGPAALRGLSLPGAGRVEARAGALEVARVCARGGGVVSVSRINAVGDAMYASPA